MSRQNRSPLIIEQMEPRILYSSDLFPLVAASSYGPAAPGSLNYLHHDVIPVQHAVHVSQVTSTTLNVSPASHGSQRSIVFIDSAVVDYQTLAAKIQANNTQLHVHDVVIIDAKQDGIKQVSAALAGRQAIDSMHIIAHGAPNTLQLGDVRLSQDNLPDYAATISHWGNALSAGAVLHLIEGDVNSAQSEHALAAGLQQLTGTAVSSCINLTDLQNLGPSTKLQPMMMEKATYVVTNTSTSGAGSLAQAINNSNGSAGANTINFNIASSGVQTISLTSALPTITNTVTIDGTTEPGFSGAPLIQISGGSAGSNASGLMLASGAAGSTVKDLIINGFQNVGIYLYGVSNVTLTGNYIGVNSTGMAATANAHDGIYIDRGSSNNAIGVAGDGNVISGNAFNGINIAGTSNIIEGNMVGLNVAGTSAIANGYEGILIESGATNNTIGGATLGAANVISGNGGSGIEIDSVANNVTGNFIGTNAAGLIAIANGNDGIYISNGGSGNVVGGITSSACNVVSANSDNGIEIAGSMNIVEGNYVGIDMTGTSALENVYDGIYLDSTASGNTIGGTATGAGNLISGNGDNGIKIYGTNNTIEDNIISGNGEDGIEIDSADNNNVAGNFIGTNAAGLSAMANSNDGIYISSGSSGNVVGGTTSSAYNVVSANSDNGIEIAGSMNIVEGNYVGTDMTGTSALKNVYDGIYLDSTASGNTIGGTATGAGNLISGNGDNGIKIYGTSNTIEDNIISGNGGNGIEIDSADNNNVAGNFIGTNAAGLSAIANANDGIYISNGSSGNVVGGTTSSACNVVSANSDNGIEIAGSMNIVEGNYVGTDMTGTSALKNVYDGIYLDTTASGNTIGGTATGAGNLISGNGDNGIKIYGTNNAIEGNFIGTNVSGDSTIANGDAGIWLDTSANNNAIGGTASGAGNVISGNAGSGIILRGSDNTVQANFIGTNASGTATLSNGNDGILLDSSSSGNTIGGTTASARNVISGNQSNGGIEIAGNSNLVEGNYIGTNASNTGAIANVYGVEIEGNNNMIGGTVAGTANVIANNTGGGVYVSSATATGNQILGNSITNNNNYGIDLNPGGANNSQAAPVLTSAVQIGGNVVITGTLNSSASTSYRVEFFSNASEDGSGYGQGQTYLGFLVVTTNGSGLASFTATLVASGEYGILVSATATNQTSLNTSQFSQDVQSTVPAGANNIVTTPENAAYTFKMVDFGFTDISGETLTAVEITTLPSVGTLTDNGTSVTASSFISLADINSGKLIWTPVTNTYGAGYDSFTFQVQDNSGAVDPTARTMTLNVTAQPPAGANHTATAPENIAYTFSSADFGFSDINGTTLSAVEITTLPVAGTLTDNGVAISAGTFVNVADINAGKLIWTRVTNTYGAGYDSFTFQVQDNSGAVDPTARTMTLNVTAQPPAGANHTATVPENIAYTFSSADFGFSDINGTTLSAVEITTLPVAGTLTDNGVAISAGTFVNVADINAGKLIWTRVTNTYGAGYDSFTFQVQDNSGAVDPTARTMTLNVTAQPPTGANHTAATPENVAYTFSSADFGFSDINGTTLSAVEITTLPVAGTLTDNGVAISAGTFVNVADINAGKLVLTPAVNVYDVGYASFTFQVQDNNGGIDSTPRTMTLNVTVQPPTGANHTVTTPENVAYTFSSADFGFSDINGTTLSAVEITTLPVAGMLTDNGVAISTGTFVNVTNINAGKLVWIPAVNAYGAGYANFTFQVRNNNDVIDPQGKTMTLNIAERVTTGAPSITTVLFQIAGEGPNQMFTSNSGASENNASGLSNTQINNATTSLSSTQDGNESNSGTETASTGSNSASTRTPTTSASAGGINDDSNNPLRIRNLSAQLYRAISVTGHRYADTASRNDQMDRNIIEQQEFKLNSSDISDILSSSEFGSHPTIVTISGLLKKHQTSLVLSSNEIESPIAEQKFVVNDKHDGEKIRVEAIEIATAISSIGLVWMTGRQVALAASFLSSMPAWQRLDPIPLLDEKDLSEHHEVGDKIDIANHLFSNLEIDNTAGNKQQR